jgi:hypothetical protein
MPLRKKLPKPPDQQSKQKDKPKPSQYTFEILHHDSSINGRRYSADSFQAAAKKAMREFKALPQVRLHCIELDEECTISSNSIHSDKQHTKIRKFDRNLKQQQLQ